jgi:hypothetical protein
MGIKRNGSQPSGKGPTEYFIGTMRITPFSLTLDPARNFGASVAYEPGTSATTVMPHIAIVERLEGKNIDWMEQVSDDQYLC